MFISGWSLPDDLLCSCSAGLWEGDLLNTDLYIMHFMRPQFCSELLCSVSKRMNNETMNNVRWYMNA